MRHVLAVDIGGTKLAAAIVDQDGHILERAQGPTRGDDGESLFAALAELIAEVRARAGVPVVACGVGCGGPMEPGGRTVSPLNIPVWRAFPLAARLHDAVGVPVTIDNDAKALALAEGWLGAARGEQNYLAMVVSTGIGAGLVVDGRLLDGAHANAGHIGHVIAVPGGRRCTCGARGCLEAEASGTAIAAWTGRDPACASPGVRRRTGRLVGEVVGSVANLLDLRLALVGGSVALGYGDVFFAEAQAALDRTSIIEFARGVRIRPVGLGADAPLVGAAAVAWRSLGCQIGVR